MELRAKPTHNSYGSTVATPPSSQLSECSALLGGSLYVKSDDSSNRGVVADARSAGNGINPTTLCGNMNWTFPFAELRTGRRLQVIVALVSLLLAAYALFVMSTPKPIVTSLGARNDVVVPSQCIFFPSVDRAIFGDPVSKIFDESLFHPKLLFKKQREGKSISESSIQSDPSVESMLNVPFPTGAFWTNLVMKPTPTGFSYPIVAYPYAFQWSESVLQASYPSLRRRVDNFSIRDIVQPDISLGVADQTLERHITKFDPLSVTLQFSTRGEEGDGYWETYLIHGSPYITTKYLNAKPILKALSTFQKFACLFDYDTTSYSGVESVVDCASKRNEDSTRRPTGSIGNHGEEILYGKEFFIQTQEGLTWILIASECIGFSFDTRIRTELVATSTFTGVLRLAFIPTTRVTDKNSVKGGVAIQQQKLLESSGFKELVDHASIYPTGGSVTWDFKSSGESRKSMKDAATSGFGAIHFKYKTEAMDVNAKSELLMLGLPHHADVLNPDALLTSSQFDLQYWCIKGRMTPVVGSTWSYDEKLTDTQFDRVADVSLDPSVANVILQNIRTDINLFPTTPTLNIYGYGKQIARLAQLAHIAKIVAAQTNSTTGLLQEITERLQESLVALLDGRVQDELLFDAKLGGVVSKNGLLNVDEDFGNGRYNDHHFHYGYLLFASAVLGMLNSTFVQHHGAAVDNLLYDIAYDGNADSSDVSAAFFPLARCKSWYDGHSFASGLFQQGNGKSQESSSEAINGYYGGYLWSMVKDSVTRSDNRSTDFTDFLRLLLAMEIRGVKTYWQMIPTTSDVADTTPQRYDPSFTKNYMVGNLGMLDAVCSTYFASELFYVHLINIIPVTAITAEVFGRTYTSEQYANVIAKAEIPGAWKGYAACNQAITDPAGAWEESLKLDSGKMDSGLSKSQVLYFISTLEDFVTPVINSDSDPREKMDQISGDDSSNASCQEHPGCFGLIGLCCPTGDGIMLECC